MLVTKCGVMLSFCIYEYTSPARQYVLCYVYSSSTPIKTIKYLRLLAAVVLDINVDLHMLKHVYRQGKVS